VSQGDDRPFVLLPIGDDNTVVGPALKEYGGNEDNCIIITDENMGGCVGKLREEWCKARLEKRDVPDSVKVTVAATKREALTEEELKRHQEKLEDAEKAKEERRERERIRTEMDGILQRQGGGGSDDASAAAAASARVVTPTAAAAAKPKSNSRFSAEVFLKFSTTQDPLTFPTWSEAPSQVGVPDEGLKVAASATITDKDQAAADMTDYGYPVNPDSMFDLVSGLDRKGGHVRDDAVKMGYVHLNMTEREEMGWTKVRSGERREGETRPSEARERSEGAKRGSGEG
jgi:hypothetical protein